MKLKEILKYAITGILLVSMPLCVQAQSVTVPNEVTTLTPVGLGQDYGVNIATTAANSGTVTYTTVPPATLSAYVGGVGTITLNGVNLTGLTDTDLGGVYGVLINLAAAVDSFSQKTINTGNISVGGTSATGLTGFHYEEVVGGPGFDGVLNIGNVNVDNNSTGIGITTYGLNFVQSTFFKPPVNIAGKVTAGNINVNERSLGNDAIGFSAGNLVTGASVTLGNVDVNSTGAAVTQGVNVGAIGDGGPVGESLSVGNVNVTSGATATTVNGINVFGGGGIGADGSLTAGNIKVNSTGAFFASGVSVNGVAAGAKFDVGKINVTSARNASGIDLVAASTFTVTKDIIAQSTAAPGGAARASL
jgi:hypothetical protein